MVQQNFPRGGKKPLKKNLPNYALLQASKLKSQKSKMKKRKGEDAQLKTGIIARAALNLTYGTLTQGMILLGRVQRSSQYDVTISLPGRLSGLLQITDISEAYTNLLQNLVSSQLPPPDFKPLSDLYKRGNYLVCYVKVIDVQSKHRVILSVQPEMINLNFDSGKLAPGSRIACSISCVEDHGYVVDTGNKNLRGFLSKNDVKVGVKYYVGQQVFCVVRSTTTTEGITTLKLTTDPKFTNSPLSSEDQHLNSLIPGTKLSVVIKKLLPDGLHISFNKDNIGYINRLYLENPLDTYEEGSQLFATFLYTLPTVKFSYFTEIALEPECATLTIGEMEKAKILFHDRKGIALRIKKNFRGYMPLKRTGVEFDQIRDKFPPNSVHKCRILTYDNFDRVYICSALKHELTLEYKIPETVTAGDLMPVQIIRESPNKFLFVKSGRILGDVPPEQIRDIDDAVVPLIGKKVLARVLSRDKNGERFNFTLKRSLVESNRPILSEFTQAQVGSTYLGTVINKSGKGLLIKFYEDLKGVIPSKALRNIPGGIKAFREGQVIEVKVANVIIQERRLILELATADKKRMICPFEIGETVEGKVIDSSVEGVHIRILNPSGNDAITAYLPAGHMSPCEKTGKQMAALSVPGDTMSALVFSTTPEFILTTTLNPQKWYTDIKNLSVSDCIPCSITQINTTGIEVLLPVKDLKCYGIVSLNKIDNIKLLFKHQILFGKITQINKKTQVIHLTTIFHEVWSSAVENDTDLIASVDVLALYLSKLKQLASFSYYSTHKISKMKLGQKVSGVVETITENGTVIKLNDGVPAIARKSHAEKSLKIGDKVNGSILWINYVDELVEITLDPILMNAIKPKQNEIPEDALKKKLKGEIVLINRWFVLVVLKGCGKGNLVALPTKAHVNDLTPDLSSYKIGAKIKCYVIMKDNESEIIPIVYRNAGFVTPKLHKSGMVDCQVKMDDNITPGDEFVVSETIQKKRKRHLENVTEKNRAMKKLKTDPITNSSSHKTKSIKTKREIALIKSKNEEQQEMFTCANESEGLVTFALAEDAEDANKKTENEQQSEAGKLGIPECGFVWDSKPDISPHHNKESSDDEDAQEGQFSQKSNKLSSAERKVLEYRRESEIRKRETQLTNNYVPNSVDEFNRLVLASPDSSFVWLQYIAYFLHTTEIEKARAVVKQALKTINFREENEKLNIWQGWLNLESRFGTAESLNRVFQEAIKTNDSQKIYLHMLKIHGDSRRMDEIERIVNTITKKFKSSQEVWVECGAMLLKMGLKEKSREIMQRAIQSLSAADHVNLMVKFAQLENNFGDSDRAATLFEKILTSYPKRVDVWSIYVDALIKSDNYDSARKVLGRAIIQTLSAKKMKTLFEKYIAFETKYGTPQSIAQARDLAVQYVENHCSGGNFEID